MLTPIRPQWAQAGTAGAAHNLGLWYAIPLGLREERFGPLNMRKGAKRGRSLLEEGGFFREVFGEAGLDLLRYHACGIAD